jgi:steroid delta-isomerase-like uncharacterized protein
MLLATMSVLVPVSAAQEASPAGACPAATPEENLAVVLGFFEEGVNNADLTHFDTVAAPDVVYHGATVGDESGLEALKRIYGEALTGLPGVQYTLMSSVADGDAVAARFAVEGVHTGDFRGLAPTGDTITWTHAAFARVECGKIAEMWAEVDQLDRLQEFGVLAEEGPAALMAGAAVHPEGTPAVPVESADCPPQSSEESLTVVDRVRAEVYNQGIFDVMPEIFAEGYRHGSANGPDAIGVAEGTKRIGGFVTALPDLVWTFDEVIAESDRVAARWTTRGTHNGDLLGFAPTGKPVEFTGISFFTVQCGKVVEFQTEMDAAGLLEQVGALVRREVEES